MVVYNLDNEQLNLDSGLHPNDDYLHLNVGLHLNGDTSKWWSKPR